VKRKRAVVNGKWVQHGYTLGHIKVNTSYQISLFTTSLEAQDGEMASAVQMGRINYVPSYSMFIALILQLSDCFFCIDHYINGKP
jgi:hypothetical protein